jgi:large subunit ribosomal protein L22
MANYKYATKVNEHMAKALLSAEAISTKHSVEICNMIRGLPLSKAKKMLEEVVAMKRAVPFKRYNDNVGHRKGGMGPGRYPIKATTKILALLNTVGANAQVKGLDIDALIIKHICSHMASRPMRMGRHRGRVSKRSHVEVVVIESPDLKKEKKPKKEIKKEAKTIVKDEKKEEIKAEIKETKEEKKDQPKAEVKKTEVKEQPKTDVKQEKKVEIKKEENKGSKSQNNQKENSKEAKND